MATKEQKAREAGIEVRSHQSDYRTPCPSCSPNRRKKKDPCLHITIKSDAVLATCFHCDFKGAYFDDQQPPHGNHRGAGTGYRTGGPPRPVERRTRWW